MKELYNLEHLSLEEFPKLKENTKIISSEINKIRNDHGLESVNLNSNIRLIYPKNWKKVVKDPKIKGFFHFTSRKCFIKLDSEKNASEKEVMHTSYKIAHELAHKSMENNGLNDYSKHLNEGFADKIAQKAMQKIWQPPEGVIIYKDKIRSAFEIVYGDNKLTILYGRLEEMSLLRAIKFNDCGVYQKLKYCAFYNKPNIAKKIMTDKYGKDVSDEIAKPSPDFFNLSKKIISCKKYQNFF